MAEPAADALPQPPPPAAEAEAPLPPPPPPTEIDRDLWLACATPLSRVPAVGSQADPPVQRLRVRDLLGARWEFRHIYRGTPRRHLLTTGWSKFVNAKLLVAGDAVVFARRPDGELIAGVRRAPRYPPACSQSESAAPGERRPRNVRARVPPREVEDAARLACEGRPFDVTYYPRQGAGEFVVPRKEVEDAMTNWEPGLQVRMRFLDAEERRSEWVNGVVRAVDNGIWRMLEIDWDESSPVPLRNRHINAWQVELVGYPPVLKKFKFTETISAPLCSADAAMAPGPKCQNMEMLPSTPIPAAGMQGGRHIGITDQLPTSSSATTTFTTQLLFPPPSSSGGSSEVVNPEEIAGSPPNASVNMPPSESPEVLRSIQLFGTKIIASPVNGSSEEVNQVPDAVADGAANEDASSTSPLELRLGMDDGSG
uniref:Uncharacterized protein n=1 Tax=Avena sativa TaxID=4498 RepID=A0ACD5Z3V9_AVESA